MADIELVIKIPENTYKTIIKEPIDWSDLNPSAFYASIKAGIPLIKGHGRIADMDEAIKCIEDVEGEDAIWAIALIDWACGKRTIIEADKAENEEI